MRDFIFIFQCFTNTKIWCYRITSLICVLPVSFCWGIYFACFAFHNIWILMPCLKAYGMNLRLLRSCFNSIIETFVKPCYMAAGYVLFNIRILKGGDPAQRMRTTKSYKIFFQEIMKLLLFYVQNISVIMRLTCYGNLKSSTQSPCDTRQSKEGVTFIN